jgi:hypothetical protein
MPAGIRAALWLLICALAGSTGFAGSSVTNTPSARDRGYSYFNDVVPDIPWSIHIFKVERSRGDLEFCTTSGKGDTIGLGIVSEQVKTLPPELGQPLAAINGDFYDKSPHYVGRPRDLQIRRGELISSPSGHDCFWIDPAGQPHITNLVSLFNVTWADGTTTPFELNGARGADSAMLYTTAVGTSTFTSDGIELILECSTTNGPWLPLRAGQVYTARVREIRTSGDTPLNRDIMVLSLGPKLVPRLPALKPGAVLKIATATVPDLAGVNMAIGGGPTLVRAGKAPEWSGFQPRHPRTALGWNKDYIFMVVVDGRQGDISVGMTFPELSAYLVKLGCDEAMNFDGGGSVTLWAMGQVMNSPSEGRERPSANTLAVVRKTRRPGEAKQNVSQRRDPP